MTAPKHLFTQEEVAQEIQRALERQERTEDQETTPGTLKGTEYHPAAISALSWFRALPYQEKVLWQEAFASCALSGNRLSEICSETFDRLLNGQLVSDRYLLGLVWTMRTDQLPTSETRRYVNPSLKKKKL